ncbi:hypothetical protein BGZ99_001307 [Dissophora globulifera]|uniref:Uncharacterized protein n=1 Tax=Dissophora globulifera TaxID=979702 RepID=A0A9P6R2V7_9FUNG|nr:hypothetical protein BGZ99_001307 [Dissophora globulifera]
MKFSTFVPAVLALGLFTASTQALPTPKHQESAVALLKRSGGGSSVIDALVKLFVDVEAKVYADAYVKIQANVCADVVVKLDATAKVLGGLITANVDVKDLEISSKAEADLEVKALIDAQVDALVVAKIDAHVRGVVLGLCPLLDHACLNKNAKAIVINVVALIKVDIAALIVKIKADVAASVKVRVNAHIKKVAIHLPALADVNISAIIRVRSDIDVHLNAFLDICAQLKANAKLIANIAAL